MLLSLAYPTKMDIDTLAAVLQRLYRFSSNGTPQAGGPGITSVEVQLFSELAEQSEDECCKFWEELPAQRVSLPDVSRSVPVSVKDLRH